MSDDVTTLDNTPVQNAFTQDAIALGQLVCMAYEMSGQGLDPPKPADFPPDYELVQNVIMDDYATPRFYGFIAHSKKPGANKYVLVIRGTLGLPEWLLDLQSMIPVSFYDYGRVGSGFADIYKTIYLTARNGSSVAARAGQHAAVDKRAFAEQVADAIQAHGAQAEGQRSGLPAPSLSVVGHSLGAALVTLYAVERLVYPTPAIDKFYTFASPLVGDPAFATAFARLHLPSSFRIFDNWDPVPHLPPLSGFVAVGTGVKIDLNTSYYFWDPLCSHEMNTYLNYFDPSHPPAPACTTLFRQAETRMLGGKVEAVAPRQAKVAQGGTTITISIQSGVPS